MEGVVAGCLEKDPARRRQRIQNAVIELKLAGYTLARMSGQPARLDALRVAAVRGSIGRLSGAGTSLSPSGRRRVRAGTANPMGRRMAAILIVGAFLAVEIGRASCRERGEISGGAVS